MLAIFSGVAAAQATAGAATDALIRDAMLYAYPYQKFMQMRHTALRDPAAPIFTTLNRLHHFPHTATPKDRWANGPIVDTLYSTDWLDLDSSPVVQSVPGTAGRYYLIAQIGTNLDTLAYVGQRIGGTAAKQIAIVAPDWRGSLPEVDQVIRADARRPTRPARAGRWPRRSGRPYHGQDAFSTEPLNTAARADEP